jgi:transcriptional regulator with XRE-family HTH domain
MADAQGAPSARARQLARELRVMREAAGLRGNEVARTLGWSASKLSRIENGRIGIGEEDLERVVELYRIPPEQAARLRTLAPRISAKGWWDAYHHAVPAAYASLLKLEADSLAVQCYCAVVPHALIQTLEYSKTVILAASRVPSPRELERRLEIVRRRQEALSMSADAREPVRFAAVLDESVILRLVASARLPGGHDASVRQIEHLISLIGTQHIDIRILELSTGPLPISAGSFSLLTPLGGSTPDVVCFENKSRVFFIEDEREVYSYVEDFERLSATALSRDESLDRLTTALDACRENRSA